MKKFFCRAGHLPFVMLLMMVMVLPAGARAAGGSLYKALVPVASQNQSLRQQGFEQGLEMVLRRLTGRTDLMDNPRLAEARTQVSQLISRFNYREIAEDERPEPELRYQLQVNFNQLAVDRLLRQNGLAIWGEDRPALLVWMASEQQGQREFVDGDSSLPVRRGISSAATQWGVPVLFPLLDFEDSGALAMSELWGMFANPIQAASRRYGVHAVLAVRVWPAGNSDRVNGRALFLFQGKVISFDFQDASPQHLAEQLMAQVAGQMAKFYAVAPEGAPERPVRIQVDNITDTRSYASLLRYIEELTAVRSVAPVRVKGSKVLLEVVIDGSVKQLDAAISLGRRLATDTIEVSADGWQETPMEWLSDLNYRWR